MPLFSPHYEIPCFLLSLLLCLFPPAGHPPCPVGLSLWPSDQTSSFCFLLLLPQQLGWCQISCQLSLSLQALLCCPSSHSHSTAYSLAVSRQERWRVCYLTVREGKAASLGSPCFWQVSPWQPYGRPAKEQKPGECHPVLQAACASLAQRGGCVPVSNTPLSSGRLSVSAQGPSGNLRASGSQHLEDYLFIGWPPKWLKIAGANPVCEGKGWYRAPESP